MYSHKHHNMVAVVLISLNEGPLLEYECFFWRNSNSSFAKRVQRIHWCWFFQLIQSWLQVDTINGCRWWFHSLF